MTKPIGYYCSVTPGDGTFLDNLQNQYGSTFEELTRLQKLLILKLLCVNLIQAECLSLGKKLADEESQSIVDSLAQINQFLPRNEHISLADAIVNQLKSQRKSQR